ncbi:MAG: XdhC family protein [Anaerolineae bacterium]
MLDILETVDKWLREDRRIALATVVETWGSSPRQAGAKMAIDQNMAMVGSVSGGCVETAVVQEALKALKDGKPRLLNYGVSDDTAWDVGLACGGKIAVYVEPLNAEWWRAAANLVRQDQAIKSAIVLQGDNAGQRILMSADGVIFNSASEALQVVLTDALTNRSVSGRTDIGETNIMLDVYQPRPRLVIVGGAHVAIALKNFAHQLGFRVVLIDPRKAFATKERFPDVELVSHQYPDKALAALGITPETYVAVLTHDPKIDDPALITALPSNARYIGVLSSRRTHEKRIARLTEAGVDPQLFGRIHIPIGLEIGAKTPEEIALCIMAEVVAVRNGVLA